MFYEGCTFDEIRAYRDLESEIFDFGNGEMKIEGWYGSEDVYLKMSLPEYYYEPEYEEFIQTYSNHKRNKYKCKKHKLNRYAKKQIDKKKIQKLYSIGFWWTIGKCDTHLYRCYKGSRSKYLKRVSNKVVRKSKVRLSGKGNIYKKLFDYWWELF